MPRPSKLTEELLAELDATADTYWSISDACACLGISDFTWRKWRKQGEQDIEAGNEDSLFSRFSLLATRAGGPKRRQLAIGTLQSILEDPNARDSDKISAATTILRLDAARKVEALDADAPFGDRQGAMDEWAASIRRMRVQPARVPVNFADVEAS